MTTKWDWIELNSGIGGSTVYGSSIETKLNETEQNNLVSPFDSARRFRAHYSWKHFPIWKVFLIRMDHPAFWRSAWLATSWKSCSGYWLNFSTDSHGKRIQQKFPSGASRGTLLKGARVSTKSRLGILRTKTLATRNFRVKTCDDNTNQFSGQNVRWQNKIMHLLESRCAVSGSGQNQPMLALCCWSWHVLVRQKRTCANTSCSWGQRCCDSIHEWHSRYLCGHGQDGAATHPSHNNQWWEEGRVEYW